MPGLQITYAKLGVKPLQPKWYPVVFGVVSGWYPVVSGGILAHLRPKSVETKGYPAATSKCFIILEGEQGTPGGGRRSAEKMEGAARNCSSRPTLPTATRFSRILPSDAPLHPFADPRVEVKSSILAHCTVGHNTLFTSKRRLGLTSWGSYPLPHTCTRRISPDWIGSFLFSLSLDPTRCCAPSCNHT